MATMHVGANADPHPSIILVPPEGWPVPTEGRRALPIRDRTTDIRALQLRVGVAERAPITLRPAAVGGAPHRRLMDDGCSA